MPPTLHLFNQSWWIHHNSLLLRSDGIALFPSRPLKCLLHQRSVDVTSEAETTYLLKWSEFCHLEKYPGIWMTGNLTRRQKAQNQIKPIKNNEIFKVKEIRDSKIDYFLICLTKHLHVSFILHVLLFHAPPLSLTHSHMLNPITELWYEVNPSSFKLERLCV